MPKLSPGAALYKCIFCHQKVDFTSIEDGLGKELKEAGFPYELGDFETLSYKTYGCPNCGVSDRDRLYKLYIDKYENFTNKTKILDFAPPLQLEQYIRPMSKGYRTADLLVGGVDDKVDITNMRKNYKDNTFDFFICSHILEHVSDDKKALAELCRVLKPGGRGILMTPIINKTGVQDDDPSVKKAAERWRRFAQDDHVRLYEKKVFLERVKATGFNVKEYGFWNLGTVNFIRNGLTFRSRLYIVSKGERTSGQ